MRVGVNLINFGPGAAPDMLRRWAEVTEGLGYHHLMTSDHIAITPDVAERYPGPFYEPVTTLAWLAATTRRVRIGATVLILPYRSPLEVARAFANIDRLSGGRLILGVGVGWSRQEYAALGVPFRRRGAIADEYLAAIRLLWTEETATFEGRFVRFEGVDARPLPVQRPHPPIWVGGRSDAALRRAARFGDGWHPLGIRTDWLREAGLPRLAEIAAEEGRAAPPPCPRIKLRLTQTPLPEDARVAGEGTLDQVRRDFADLAALGCPDVLLDTYTGDVEATRNVGAAWRMLAVLAEEVLDLERETLR